MIGSNCFCLVNGRVITPDSIISPGGVVVEGSRIKQVAPQDQLSIPLGSHVLDVQGRYISPGFIDLHLHGGGGADTMDATPDALRTIARTHARGGATAIVPSTVTSSIEELMAAIAAFDDAMKEPTGGAKLLGLHLEGPYSPWASAGAGPALHQEPLA